MPGEVPTTTVGAIAAAVKEISALVRELFAGKEIARYKYRTEAGMKYYLVDHKVGEFEGISDDRQKKLKVHYGKQIFDES